MRISRAVAAVAILLSLPAMAEGKGPGTPEAAAISPPSIARDAYGIAWITAVDDVSAAYGLGVVHAEDRLFQMDLMRRQASGRLAELVGAGALGSDIQFRTLGLGRAAVATAAVLNAATMDWLQAYTDGVNSVLADTGRPLPPEYADLELTRGSIPAWTPVDSLVVLKLLVFGWSFDLSDLDRSFLLDQYETAGVNFGFDGASLLFEDLSRAAPFSSTTMAKGAPAVRGDAQSGTLDHADYIRRAAPLLRRTVELFGEVPLLERALQGGAGERGSNWWLLSGSTTESGHPILASDPHIGLDTPALFHQVNIEVSAGIDPEMRMTGATLPGIPAILHGCNPRGCWGSATDPVDVTDIYLETVVIDGATGLLTHTTFDGALEPIVSIDQTYRVNQVGDATDDNLIDAGIPPASGGVTLVVPRRNDGPIVSIDVGNSTALSIQYTGNGATREIEALLGFRRAYTVDQFRNALASWDTGSQSWAWADIDGTIGYFASGEIPLREDLQQLGSADGGVPPFLIRNGTGALRHEWLQPTSADPTRSLGFEILPATELPATIDPAAGWLAAANNDPLGLTLDNDPLDETRPGGGVFYLGRSWALGLRADRIRTRIEAELAGGGKVSLDEARAIQADNVLGDALFFVRFIAEAWDRLGPAWPGADAAAMAEAVGRLTAWDGSTPTGIQEGYDPGDDPNALPVPSAAEVDASIAATIYAVWRERIIRRTIDDALAGVGGLSSPSSTDSLKALAHLFAGFPGNAGVGASGLELIPGGDLDGVVLLALSEALASLASPAMDDAFGGSTNQAEYRWGRLHRIVLDHPLGGAYNVPPAGGFGNLAANLPGLARSGGFSTVDQASHSARADAPNEFMFGSGAGRRLVADVTPDGIETCDVIPGGASGVTGDPHATDQLPLWLTHACQAQLLAPLTQNLTVSLIGNGSGSVTSEPAGIDCGPDCTEMLPWGASVALQANPDPDSLFLGFTGDPDCLDGMISLTADVVCTAEFALPALTLSATKTVAGEFFSGGIIEYTITIINAGPGDGADNPGDELVDVLPTTLELLSATASSGVVSMDSATRTVRWNGAITAGSSVVITIEAAVAPGPRREIANQATVFYDADGDGQNEASATSDDPTTTAPNDSTVFTAATAIAAIPTLGFPGLLLLILLVALVGTGRLR